MFDKDKKTLNPGLWINPCAGKKLEAYGVSDGQEH